MEAYLALSTAQQITTAIVLAGLIAFCGLVIVVMIKLLKPSRISKKDGVVFGEESSKKEPQDRTSIMHHKLFKFFEQCETTGALSLGSNDKAVVLSNFLKVKFKVLYDGFWDFFEKAERNDFEGLSKLPNLVNEWIEEYEAKIPKMKSKTSKGEICGLPSCAIHKFAHWHKRHATQLFDDYDNALSDRIYSTRRERAFAMCLSTYFALRETIQDAALTLMDLNGDFDRELTQMLERCEDD